MKTVDCLLCKTVINANDVVSVLVEGIDDFICLECAYKVHHNPHPYVTLNKVSHEIMLYEDETITAYHKGFGLYVSFEAQEMDWGQSGNGQSLYYSVEELTIIVWRLERLTPPPTKFISQLKKIINSQPTTKVRVLFC